MEKQGRDLRPTVDGKWLLNDDDDDDQDYTTPCYTISEYIMYII
jgi:hypothetical protein